MQYCFQRIVATLCVVFVPSPVQTTLIPIINSFVQLVLSFDIATCALDANLVFAIVRCSIYLAWSRKLKLNSFGYGTGAAFEDCGNVSAPNAKSCKSLAVYILIVASRCINCIYQCIYEDNYFSTSKVRVCLCRSMPKLFCSAEGSQVESISDVQ